MVGPSNLKKFPASFGICIGFACSFVPVAPGPSYFNAMYFQLFLCY